MGVGNGESGEISIWEDVLIFLRDWELREKRGENLKEKEAVHLKDSKAEMIMIEKTASNIISLACSLLYIGYWLSGD